MTHCRVPDCGAKCQGFICRPCLNEVDRALGDYGSMLHELSVLATKQTHVYRANGTQHASDETTDADYDEAERWEWLALPAQLRSRTAKSSLPATATMVNLGARDLLDEAINTIVTWARHLNESGTAWSRRVQGAGFIVTLRGDPPASTQEVLGWLLRNIDVIRWDEAADEIHRDLTRLHHRMRRAVDRIPSRVVAGPCRTKDHDGTRCERPLFSSPQPSFDDDSQRRAWEDDNPIMCDGYRPTYWRPEPGTPAAKYPLDDQGCGAIHTRESRRAWQLADIEDRLLPWSLLEDALPGVAPHLTWPHRTTWARWQKLVAVKMVHDGTPFYRGGDVIDLCYREQGRIKGNNGKRDKPKRERIAG